MYCPKCRVLLSPFKCQKCGYVHEPKTVKRLDVMERVKIRDTKGRYSEAKRIDPIW